MDTEQQLQDEKDKQQIKAEFTRTYTIPSNYLGLQNIGATCYMNSVLQTLFMTPEFRRGLYQWTYKDDEDGEKDSIPFQLQRLFGRLQTKVFDYVDTRDLTKSFQWDVHQAFEQHDIQEFIRILFDAIEQSLVQMDFNFVKELYEGVNLYYTRCCKCGYESSRQQNFLDYTLILKNKWEKVYNNTLEKALQVSMKPELLNGANQYFCEQCQCKQDAQRGQRILKVPTLLCLHVNRFAFDLMLGKREKLDDFMSFPYTLNINNYMNGYEGIPNKLDEKCDPAYFEEKRPKPAARRPFPQPVSQNPKPAPPKVQKPGGKTHQSSSQTKSFLDEIRKNKKLNPTTNNDNDIQIYGVEQEVDEDTQKAIQASLKVDDAVQIPVEQSQAPLQGNPPPPPPMKSNIPVPPPPPPMVYDQMYEEEQIQEDQTKLDQVKQKVEQLPEIQIPVDVDEDRRKYFHHVEKQNILHNQEQDQLVQEYLKDGEYVYQLYSILNHTGGAFGGHYYAFIKSFEDSKWYSFNDSNITGLAVDDIPKRAFGGPMNNNNAYMLFYRRIDNFAQTHSKWGGTFDEKDLPQRIQVRIEQERKKLQEYLEIGGTAEGLLSGVRPVTLKVYFKLENKLVQCSSNDTFEQIQETAFQLFGVKDKVNCRLRGYQPHSDTLCETYSGREKLTLMQLKICTYKSFSFEFRLPDQEWGTYDELSLSLRYTVWNDKITIADENNLEKIKLAARKDMTVSNLIKQLREILGYPDDEQLLISKRHTDYGFDIAKHLNTSKEDEVKLLENCELQDNNILYIEPLIRDVETLKVLSKWSKQFDLDTHMVSIRFNHPEGKLQVDDSNKEQVHQEMQPSEEFPHSINIDNRLTLQDMKVMMCAQLNLDPSEVIMRRGGKAGLELKNVDMVIELSHFVKGSSVYLEHGCPLRPGEYRCIISISERNQDIMEDRNLYIFRELGEYPINGDKQLSHYKDELISWASKKSGQEINPRQVHLRERISERLTKVYRDRPLKEQGILEKRMISIEAMNENQNEWLNQREQLIIVKFWDQTEWTLSDKYELVISKNESAFDLATKLSNFFPQIDPANMEAARIVALYRFNRYDLYSEDWHSLNSDEILLGSQPLFLTNDGSLVVVRDCTQQARELSEEEQKKFGIIQSQYAQSKAKLHPRVPGIYTGGHSYDQKEKALKITVKKKEEKQKEQQEPEQIEEQPIVCQETQQQS